VKRCSEIFCSNYNQNPKEKLSGATRITGSSFQKKIKKKSYWEQQRSGEELQEPAKEHNFDLNHRWEPEE